jgi:general secretion pathway protein D
MNRTKLRTRLLAMLLGAALAVPVLAQDDQLVYTPNFREPTDILQVIDVVNEITGRRMIPDPRVRGIQVILYNSDAMSADQVWQLFLEMLQGAGLVAIETATGAWRILPEQNLRTEATPVERGAGAEVVTRSLSVDNISAQQLVPIIRPMMSQAAQLGAVQNTNSLILVDRADNIDRIERIIAAIDDVNAADIALVPLQFAAAEDVTQKLQQLVQGQAASGLVGLQAVADERTNSVLLTGPTAQIATYRRMVEQLDRPSTQGGGSQVRYLHYADAEDVAMNLQAQFGGAQVLESAETAGNPIGGNVTVWADVPTNSLVMAAPSSVMRDMLAIVDSLDIPRAQVHVQAIIVEMSESRAAQLGLTWLIDGSSSDQAVALTNYGVVGGILQLAQIGAGGAPDPSVIPEGVTAAVGSLNDTGTSWASVVQALDSDGDTHVLQLPELVVLDNAEATIHVGQQVPFLTGSYAQTGAGAGGGINPFQTVDREPVGTTLTITPRINEGTGMRLSISQEVSSISSSSIASDVITNTREITTEVFVNDGDILVLGGLLDDQLRENDQGIPGLRRIPGLRWLFGARNASRDKSNLMVFIRPTILRTGADAARMSTEKYRVLQQEHDRQAEKPVRLLPDVQRPDLPPLRESDTQPSGDDQPLPTPSDE